MSKSEIVIVVGMSLVTFLTRYLPLVWAGRVELPERLLAALRFVPIAVLTAIIAPALLMPRGTLDLGPANAYLPAGIAAVVVSRLTGRLLPTILCGLLVFFGWRAFFG